MLEHSNENCNAFGMLYLCIKSDISYIEYLTYILLLITNVINTIPGGAIPSPTAHSVGALHVSNTFTRAAVTR